MTEPSLDFQAPHPRHGARGHGRRSRRRATATVDARPRSRRRRSRRSRQRRRQSAVPIDRGRQAKLDAMVASYLDAVSTLDPHSPAFTDKVNDIAKLGDDDIRASAAVSNRLLDKPLAAMQNGGLTETSAVSKSLLSLRRQVEDLDPAQQGDLLSPHKLLGMLPVGTGDRLRDYFEKYQSSQHSSTRSSPPVPRAGRAPARQRRDRAGEGQPLDGHGPPAPVRLPGAAARRRADGADRRRSRRPTRSGPRCSRRTCSSPSARSTRTC